MKKKRLAILLSGIAVIAAIGGTYAAFVASSNPITKDVTAPELGISIEQSIDTSKLRTGSVEETEDGLVYSGGVPGAIVPEQVSIAASEKSTDCYVRVTVYRSWWSQDGTEKITDSELADPQEIDIKTANEADWIIQPAEDDPEVIYFYYKKPLTKGMITSNLMDSFTILEKSIAKDNNSYAGLGVHIEFEADAIQKVAAEDAMLAEWGIEASFSGDELVSFTEQ